MSIWGGNKGSSQVDSLEDTGKRLKQKNTESCTDLQKQNCHKTAINTAAIGGLFVANFLWMHEVKQMWYYG